ncbi:SUMF1/EgtB/PvdO family nonheme iron enzyme [Bernardetia sp. ABR2-2B]|uniref:formylglycine-generating enzyme family protein n=1 Tax=Bernardetia sp. ABR2-2B TaxID=3127472 RepID=UPI0030CC92B6
MKNIFLIVFLFLPFVSYSQVVSHSFEDSVLTVFIKPSNLQSETDTIYPNGIPKKVNFVFEDLDSNDKDDYIVITLARGRQPIKTHTYNNIKNDESYAYPISYIVWKDEYFIIQYNNPVKDSVETLFQKIYILPKPILEKIEREEKERIQDSLNRIAAIEYHQKRFDKLKESQENLTKKDKKKIAKVYSKVTPPNGIEIDTAIFMDETEISNVHWVEYLYYLNKDSSKNCYLENLSNTVIFDSVYFNPYVDHYPRYPRFKNHPVVGISYQQAQGYCIWRANMVNDGWKKENKNKDYEVIVHYRLPTEKEWEYAAIKDDLNYQLGGYSTRRRYTEKEKRKIYRSAKKYADSTYSIERVKLDMKNYFESDTSYKRMFNYKTEYKKPYFDGGFASSWKGYGSFDNLITNWIYLYKPTRHFGIYNIFGNVAEMTATKGIAKGGSFVHTLEECAADRVQKYDAPKAWLGFRCLAEIVVRKKETE